MSNQDNITTTLKSLAPYIDSILRSSLEMGTWDIPPRTLELPAGNGITLGIQIPDQVDLQQVHKKIQKQHGEKEKEIQRLESRLASPNFKEKADPSVIEESQNRLTKLNDDRMSLHLAEQQFANFLSS